MAILRWTADMAVPVRNRPSPKLHGQPLREFAPMVRLHGMEGEGRVRPGRFNEAKTLWTRNPFSDGRICPPGADINERVNVQPIIRRPIMDRINFHQDTWLLWLWTRNVLMPLLPLGMVRV